MSLALASAALALLLAPARHAASLALTRAPIERLRAHPPVAAVDQPEEYVGAAFDKTLAALLQEARQGSFEGVVDEWLDRLDDNFIPSLGERVEAPLQADDVDELRMLMDVLTRRSSERFDRAKAQLEQLLEAGEINKLDRQLVGLMTRDELDGGFLYVLFKNIEDAQQDGDETRLRLLQHLHTRVQEEMEKKADPGLALLHKLTRTESAAIRGNILEHYLTPQTSVTLPDGTKMPLNPPAAAMVTPMVFAAAVEGALDKVMAMSVDRRILEATAEDIRSVAKEAHRVIVEEYSQAEIEEFQDALTPVFARALPKRTPAGEPKLHSESD